MSEINTQMEQGTNSVEKAIGEQASRIEAAIGEVNKLQTKGLNQAGVFIENAIRIANGQLALAQQVTAELQKLVLAGSRRVADVFASKKA